MAGRVKLSTKLPASFRNLAISKHRYSSSCLNLHQLNINNFCQHPFWELRWLIQILLWIYNNWKLRPLARLCSFYFIVLYSSRCLKGLGKGRFKTHTRKLRFAFLMIVSNFEPCHLVDSWINRSLTFSCWISSSLHWIKFENLINWRINWNDGVSWNVGHLFSCRDLLLWI